nr:uncharacterized protein LOC127340110 [Lolium perenne]
MHVFVKHFNKFLYDRDAEESFQEKRTRLGGVVYKVGEPMEKHAAKIYTRTIFEKFQEVLYKYGSYYGDELVPGEIYVAKHFGSESLEKWRKVEYKLSVKDGYCACECGTCPPQVHGDPCPTCDEEMDSGRAECFATPPGAVPEGLGPGDIYSSRHSQLYLNCMEVVRLGDVNVDAYTTAMESIMFLVPKLKLVAVEADGLGLEQSLSAKKARVDIGPAHLLMEQATGSKDCGAAIILDAALLAPSENKSSARPTTSRDKPPYETTLKRTRFCTICKQPGHKSTTCADHPPGAAKPRKEAKCSNCDLPGHRKTSCIKQAAAM